MRRLDRGGGAPDTLPPQSEPAEAWGEVAALAPHWRPSLGETELAPVRGQLAMHHEGLVFRAADVVDATTGEPVVELPPGGAILSAGPLSPGSLMTPTRPAGEWMPRLLRGLRCPGFVVSTASGAWIFDGPRGVRHAQAVHERFGTGEPS